MNPYTGETVAFSAGTFDEQRTRAADHFGISAAEVLLVQGADEAVAELSHRARLGEAEIERRKARRKAQRAARKKSR